MTDSDRILVFIPAYRCAPQIVRVLDQFADPTLHERFDEILVIDNRSPDDTAEAAVERARSLGTGRMSVARNVDNFGLGGSHKSAFTYALANAFSHVLVLHGDDQGDIRDALPVLDAGEHRHYDCCLGARFHPRARIQGYSPLRVAGNHVFNGLFSLGSGRRLYDLGSGLNLYRVEPLADRYWLRFPDNLMFNYCMILAHVHRGDRIRFFPISWREEDQLSNVKLVSQATRTLGILASYVVSRRRFLERELREEPRQAYEFEILAGGL
jgi:glycosyltransferase involved in cell wall biosynthesis